MGITLTDARSGLAGADLTSEMIAGEKYWLRAAPAPLPENFPHDFQLLPGFDEYLIGYADRGAVLPGEHVGKVVPGGNGIFQPVIVSAGQVVGTWKRTLKKDTVEITLLPFTRLSVPQETVLAAAERYGRFLGLRKSLA